MWAQVVVVDLKVDWKKMEVSEEEIVEVVDRDVSLAVLEKNVVEDRFVYKVMEADMMVVVSMPIAMGMYQIENFGTMENKAKNKVEVVSILHTMDFDYEIVEMGRKNGHWRTPQVEIDIAEP